MAHSLILHRYLLKEMIPPFILNLGFFMFVFLMHQILVITNMIVNYQVGLIVFFLMLIYAMPYFLTYIIPMSVMMGVLLAFLRLSSDNEIVALKASGVSLYGLIPPVLLFGAVGALLTGFMAIYGTPWGNSGYKQLALGVARTNLNIGIKEGRFNDSFNNVMFYVKAINPADKSLEDVYIEDQRTEGISSVVLAPKGCLFQGPDPYSFILRLYNGAINQVNLQNRSAHTVRFDTYDLQMDLKDAVEGVSKRKKERNEMSLAELKDAISRSEPKSRRSYAITYHQKFSIPFACIVLAVLAVPLGIQSFSARRSAGLGIGLFFFLIYYLLLSAGLILSEFGAVPPVIGMWMPNLIMGGIGLRLLLKTANDQPMEMFALISRCIRRFTRQSSGRTQGPA